jgi:serine/threonine-protein kinase
MAQTNTAMKLAPGTIVGGRYEVTGYLGAGGFATVYAGIDPAIDRQVAIKILKVSGEDGDKQADAMVERFKREAKAAAKIRHSGVVSVFDVGKTADGHPFIVMEHLSGRPLDVHLQEHGGMVPERAISLMVGCLDALGEAHRLGIIHKDLKPANLFLTDPETDHESLAILDFGVAGVQGEDTRLTGTGQVLGTPQYMAPEYIVDQHLTAAVDVYQCGLIMVEMLTGTPVVNKNQYVHCLMTHAQGDLDIPRTLLMGPLGPLLTQALVVNPDHRFPNADAFRKALESIDAATVTAPPANDTPIRLSTTSQAGMAGVALNPSAPPETGSYGAGAAGSTQSAAINPEVGSPPTQKSNGPLFIAAGVVMVLLLVAVAGGSVVIIKMMDEEIPDGATAAPIVDGETGGDPEKGADAPAGSDSPAGADVAGRFNTWVWIPAPTSPVRLGVDPARRGIPVAKWKKLAPRLNAFVPGANVMAPSQGFHIQQHEITWAEIDPWLEKPTNHEHRFNSPAWASGHPKDKAATGVPWATADAFCVSAEGRLPTEEEWEYAARGPDRRTYPWGDSEPQPGDVNAMTGDGSTIMADRAEMKDRTPEGGGHTPVAAMLGNAQEWTDSVWRSSRPEEDSSWATEGGLTYRVVRGWPLDGRGALPIEGLAHRSPLCAAGSCVAKFPGARAYVGFRCVRETKPAP